jgi:hypothetical protein
VVVGGKGGSAVEDSLWSLGEGREKKLGLPLVELTMGGNAMS